MSRSVSLYTTAAALAAADAILGPNRTWRHTTPFQEKWLRDVFVPCREGLPRIKEIVTNATWDAANHAAFMKKHGWEAQIKELEPDHFATAGVMDLGVEWIEEGVKTRIWREDADVNPDAATVTAGVKILRHSAHDQPIACLDTKSGDRVWMTRIDTEADGQDLAALSVKVFTNKGNVAAGQRRGTIHPSDKYEGVTFPMVDLSQKRELDQLVDLYTFTDAKQRAFVAKAVQQLTFKMNHKGARARAADEMDIGLESMCSGPTPLVIDGPFLLAIERRGLKQPLFVTHVTEEDWKDPGEI